MAALRGYWRTVLGFVFVGLVFMGPRLLDIYGELLWFQDLGFSSVYLTMLTAKIGLFVAGTVVSFAILYGGYRWTVQNIRAQKEGYASSRLAAGALAVLALLFGGMAAARWETVLTFLHAEPFHTSDPVFAMDAAFYVFQLPFYQFVLGFLTLVVVISVGLSLALYALHFGTRNIQEQVEGVMGGMMGAMTVERTDFNMIHFLDRVREHAYAHVMVGLGTLLLLGAGAFMFARYELLYSQQGVVYGVGYTDLAVSVPLLFGLAVISAVAGVVAFASPWLRKGRVVGWLVALLVVVMVLGNVAGWAVQSYVVEPDEFNKERQHIEHEINHTRTAFALERVSEREFPVSEQLTREQIDANPGTIDNVRLWDWRPLLKTYNELQIFRTYYTFTDVDVDRYQINGSSREVMVSPREIDVDALPPRSQSWVNRHLVYTHGYGLTMSPVRDVTGEGLPKLLVKDIPPTSSANITIDQPRIYYGENTDSYAVVNTGTREFDYPGGDQNVYTSYDGSGGVQLSSTFRKLVYAVKMGSPQLFFSDSITPDSQLQFHRSIQDRVRTVAPFLEFDQDPYIVTTDGRMYWIYDAYTTSDKYPYSRPVQYRGADTNYMRNSVKVVVDAYTGEMDFYVAEPDDPLIQTYENVFPVLFQEMDAMPDSVREHVRYPEDLFKVQADVYRDYHMTDPNVFYNREDQWRVPNEILRGKEVAMEPYYIIMTLPGEDEPEFMQILPFIPRGKENMIGWMAARSDPPHYGNLQAFKFSKQELIFGPMQIESRIDQDADISQQITLWSQSGSQVLRGNLLPIPIDDTILYVEPLFLESREQGALPELKRVIVGHNDRITMQPTLDDALAVLFGEQEDQGTVTPPGTGTGETVDPAVLDRIRTLFREGQAALQRGDFATYGEKTAQIEQLLAENQNQTQADQ